jgi:hypothetical protein
VAPSRILGRRWLEQARPHVERRVLAPLGTALETVRALKTRIEISLVGQRVSVVRRFPEAARSGPRTRVVVVVTHVVDPTQEIETGVSRLEQTLDGVLQSLDHADLQLVLNTVPERHVAAHLPMHLRSRLDVREQHEVDRLFVGFAAQDEFARRIDDADWFLYLEDDLIVNDSLLLEKLAYFNAATPKNAVLLPHRYELWNGSKVYIDLCTKQHPGEQRTTNALTRIQIDAWKFGEFENPHSGTFCLSREQLDRWLGSGRHWYGLSSYVGPRESAATGCLTESFRLYKPHPDNMNFLEVRHLGTKYSELYAQLHDA